MTTLGPPTCLGDLPVGGSSRLQVMRKPSLRVRQAVRGEYKHQYQPEPEHEREMIKFKFTDDTR
jgi:hypothetical protein